MTASPFNAMHAAAHSAACSTRAFVDAAGEAHGRDIMGLVLDRLVTLELAMSDAVLKIAAAEAERMATVYAEAGCSRRQVRAFVRAYRRGAVAGNAEASVLLGLPHHGSA